MLKVQQFIKDNPNNWEKLLTDSPYNLKINEDEHFYIFKYSQIKSDFSNEIVQECRGIILDKKDFSVAGRGFNKFFNLGEPNEAKIDWKSALVFDKIDGSIIKIFYNKYTASWQTASNGTINAKDAELQDNLFNIKNYHDLVMYTLDKMNISFGSIVSMVPKDFTIVCEITSPANRVIIPYNDFVLTHLTTINNKTGDEVELILGLPKPEVYSLTTLEETIEACKNLNKNDTDKEGFVVKDKYNNRIKIKSTKYLQWHRLKGESAFTEKRILDIVRENEQAELLSYFPEYKKAFVSMEEKYENFLKSIQKDTVLAIHHLKDDRKTYAEWAKTKKMPSILFSFYDGKISNVEEGLKGLVSEKLLRYL